MLIRIAKCFVIPFLFLIISFQSTAKDYKLDKDYKIVSEKKTQTPEIREFFSFYCSHCYSMRKNFKEISVAKPKEIILEKKGEVNEESPTNSSIKVKTCTN